MTAAQSLVEIIQEHLASDEPELPVFSSTVTELQSLLSREDFTIDEISNVLLRDQALCGQVLRLANSSFFAGLKEVTTIPKAIARLGSKQVLICVVMAAQRNLYVSRNKIIAGYMKDLWKHAVACALGAKWIAEKTGFRHLAQEAFLAALLHDIGKLFLLKVLEDIAASGERDITLSDTLIAEILDYMHCKLGFELLRKWNIPEMYCAVARDHHQRELSTDSIVQVMVRLADQTARKIGISMHHDPSIILATLPEANLLGIKEITLAELEILMEDTLSLSA
ncbi:MAG: HDOD domain-containing protein [Syntrophobacteraceae bacterium]